MGDKEAPFIPPIPPDAKVAASHAPPSDLNNPAAAPTPSVQAAEDEGSKVAPDPQPVQTPRPPRAQPAQESHPPTEAMFYQLREDQQRMQKMVAMTLIALVLAAMVILWLSKPQSLKLKKAVSDVQG